MRLQQMPHKYLVTFRVVHLFFAKICKNANICETIHMFYRFRAFFCNKFGVFKNSSYICDLKITKQDEI